MVLMLVCYIGKLTCLCLSTTKFDAVHFGGAGSDQFLIASSSCLCFQFIGTAALLVCILAIVDPYNNPVPKGLEAFTVGFVILVIGTSMGFNSGYAVNPARDFGPRLFTAIAGWGTEVFTYVSSLLRVPHK